MKTLSRKTNDNASEIANRISKKHSCKSRNAANTDSTANTRIFYKFKRLLTVQKKKNAHSIKAGAVYCPFDEKKQAFIVPDGFLDDWDA